MRRFFAPPTAQPRTMKRKRRSVMIAVCLAGLLVTPGVANADDVGLVDTSTGQWHLRLSPSSQIVFYYGNPGDYPFSGDWNCDGITTPGLYRQSDGYVYLRNSNTSGIADVKFFFGDPGDVPLAGDFNGDGCDTVSIYRPSNQTFYIINELGSDDKGLGAADFDFVFGNPDDTPFVGDFDGDDVDEVGLYRATTGFMYFRNTLTTGVADKQFYYGNPGDRFVAGDWEKEDGTDSPGIFRPSEAKFYLKYEVAEGVADESFQFGQTPWLPIAGNWFMVAPPPPGLFAVAYTDMVDDGGAYDPAVDVLIAKLVDGNGDGVPGAGDLVVTDRYPINLSGTQFANFGVTQTTVDAAYAIQTGCFAEVNPNVLFRWDETPIGEGYTEAPGGGGWSAWSDRFTELEPGDQLNVWTGSPSSPTVGAGGVILRPGDDVFVDVEEYCTANG